MKSALLSAVAAVAMTFGAAGAVQAGVVNWTISNGVFSDGGTLNGTFSIDTSNGDITNWDLVSTPGADGSFPGFPGFGAPAPTQFGTEYSPVGPNSWFAGTNGDPTSGSSSSFPVFAEAIYWASDQSYFFTSQLDLSSVPYPGGGTYSLAGSTEDIRFFAEIPTGVSRSLVSGEAVSSAVPEPATWAMLILGLGMIGFAARRRSAALALAA